MDQLMGFAWKFMLPMALVNIVVTGIWHFMPPGITRWFVCGMLVLGPYLFLARGLVEHSGVRKRTYRYAE
jgi:NADH-quinone oxidoreductase subunit H